MREREPRVLSPLAIAYHLFSPSYLQYRGGDAAAITVASALQMQLLYEYSAKPTSAIVFDCARLMCFSNGQMNFNFASLRIRHTSIRVRLRIAVICDYFTRSYPDEKYLL